MFNFIGKGEGFGRMVYSDGVGIPTIGYGYALVTKNAAGVYSALSMEKINKDFLGVKAFLATGEDWIQLSEKMEDAVDFLNVGNVSAANALFPTGSSVISGTSATNVLSWEITADQGEEIFNKTCVQYTNHLKKVLDEELYTSLNPSKELLALYSLAFNGKALTISEAGNLQQHINKMGQVYC